MHVDSRGQQLAPVIQRYWNCSESDSRVIAERGHVVSYANRDSIYVDHTDRRHVGLIMEGEARAIAYSFDGRQVLVEEFEAGDLYGEIVAFAGPDGRQADEVVAHGEVTSGQFSTGHFITLMEQHNCIALAVARTLHQRLAQANRRVVQIATVSAPGRVHGELFKLGQEAGWRLEPAPVVSEIALAVQTTRETASRAISNLEKRGIVKREGRALIIIAPHRLEGLIY